jgi:two-component system, NarL family, nitrate/nitrite response regulator NarL
VRGGTSLRRTITTGSGPTSVSTGERPYPSPATARVLVVGDVRLYRELLENAVADEEGFEVVGSASCDVATMAAGISDPDVVVVDTASLTVPDGMHTLATALPDAKIVGIGVADDEDSVVALLEAGASGYVSAEQPLSDLVAAVEAAANGELPCPPQMSAALAKRLAVLAARAAHDPANDALTPRQREIASLIADGLSNKQIARRLSIEQATVKNHVHSILVKLGVSRRDQVGRRLASL